MRAVVRAVCRARAMLALQEVDSLKMLLLCLEGGKLRRDRWRRQMGRGVKRGL